MATIVITGANRGIGLALTELYLAENNRVIALCRQASTALSATSAEVIEGVDVGDPQSLAELPTKIKQLLPDNATIDVLINNAGVLFNESIGALDYQHMLQQYQVNALGPVFVTDALLNYLAPAAKVIMITSRMGSMADNGSGGYYGYRMSKAALNAAAISFTRDLESKGIAVGILHPGFVQTEMVGGAGHITAKQAAAGLAQRILELSLATTGSFRHSDGQDLPW